MSIINKLANDIWTEVDIVNHGRAVIASVVSEARQQELRTIMLGQLAGMRAATPDEMAEVILVQTATEAQVVSNDAARADMALLQSAMGYEVATARLLLPAVTEPATIIVVVDEVETALVNPAIAIDLSEREAAQAVIDAATQPVLDLVLLRNPPIVDPVVDPVVEVTL